MAEYIEREALIEKLRTMPIPKQAGSANTWLDNCAVGVNAAIWEVASFPTADVAQVVYGRWIHSRYEDCSEQFELVKCSQCNHEAYAMAIYVHGGNYCPNCGAKMDGGADHAAD